MRGRTRPGCDPRDAALGKVRPAEYCPRFAMSESFRLADLIKVALRLLVRRDEDRLESIAVFAVTDRKGYVSA